MLYTEKKKEFSSDAFQMPGACYRGAPFWAWNCWITKDMIDEQIQYFKEMGMGGFHVHVRVGLKNQYMGDEFLELVRYCDQKAKENGMLCWLYDEDRYSSGIAGGEVTKNVAFRARSLKLTTQKINNITDSREQFLEKTHRNEKTAGCLLKLYDIELCNGFLTHFEMYEASDLPLHINGKLWYLYEVMEECTPWCNNQTYVDTMNEDATKSFIEKTHEKYASVLQQEFGISIPAIFTDEPHITGMMLSGADAKRECIGLPFTEKLPEIYKEKSGMEFFQSIPKMIWNRKEKEISKERYFLYDVCAEQFVSAYCKTINSWCKKHEILSTGHILGEESLSGQASTVGEAMRCYREMELPGIDNLCDFREFSSVKQASSVAHQLGKEGIVSELYGVTQWDFDFEGYKLAGDWQAALGITTRVPHLAWASMSGEAKRDYPAAIGWQSPWYKEFHYIEDHFARINYCLTRGEPIVHVGVIHPIETMWIYQGVEDVLSAKRDQLEINFKNITEWLLTNGIDFDFISESILEETVQLNEAVDFENDRYFVCGKMKYDVVIVPDCIHLRSNTFRRLICFQKNGGTVILCGTTPKYIDGREDEQLQHFINKCHWVPIEKNAVLQILEPWREIDIKGMDGSREEFYLHQIRCDQDERWFFLAQAYRGMRGRQKQSWKRRALHEAEQIKLYFKGCWNVESYDTLTGEKESVRVEHQNGATMLHCALFGNDSLLLHLKPIEKKKTEKKNMTECACKNKPKKLSQSNSYRINSPMEYYTDEPNVLLLDKFQYALEDEPYSEECELLRVDNLLRKRLGYPLRMEQLEQPYISKKPDVREHRVRLKVIIDSQIAIEGCQIALEEPQYYCGTLNQEEISMKPVGYYVDKAIQTVRLPGLKKGKNELILELKYGKATNLEWMYLLGEFGVTLFGRYKQIVAKPALLYWGDYTRQGYPFYTGNMTYSFSVFCKEKKDLILHIPYYKGAAVKVSVDRKDEKLVAFLPYQCELKELEKGTHIISVTCLGNRYNGFGQLHMIGNDLVWKGPDSWRTRDDSWTEEYQIKPMGILSAPVIK